MNFRVIIPGIVLILLLTTSSWSQPELVYSQNEKSIKIEGIDNNKPYYLEKGEKKFFLEGGTSALRISKNDILSFGFVPVNYTVNKSNDDSSLNAVIAIVREARKGTWNHININDFLKLWDEDSLKNARLLSCWYNPDSELQTVNKLDLFPYFKNRLYETFLFSEIESNDLKGFPVLFLWKDNSFIPPESPWSDNADLFKSIILDDQDFFKNNNNDDELKKAEDKFKNRAIHYAAALGRTEILKMLLDKGADADDSNDNRMTPVLVAAATAHSGTLNFLIQHDPRLLKARNDNRRSALHFAAHCGHEDIVNKIVQYDNKINIKDSYGFYPVGYAINRRHDPIVGILASKGAKLEADADNQQLLLLGNVSRNNPNIVSFLLEQKAKADKEHIGTTPLIIASGSSSLDVVTRLIDSGADINKSDGKKITPLMSACLTGRKEVVKYLLEKGANVNEKSKDGISAIEAAVLRNDPEIIDLLVSHNVDIETEGKTGKTPFWLAAMLGYRESMDKLLNVGARCDLNNDRAIELMELAFRYDMPEAVDLALEQCLHADFLFYEKYPSTWVADYYSADEILDLLVEHGAKKNTGEGLGIVNAGELSEKPRIIQATPIYYPLDLKRKYGSRKFKAKVVINDKGEVLFPRMIDSEVHELDRIVMETLTKWRFSAPLDNEGKACSVMVNIPILLECEDIEKQTWELSEVDVLPRPLKTPAPRYPIELREKGINGRVVIDLIIDENGVPEQIKISSLTHKEFAEAAIEAVKKYRYTPAYYQGKPVKIKVKQPLNFIPVQ